MLFHKYHAAGNDFIITDDPAVIPAQAPALCDRRTGIGADGILLHRPAPDADAEMVIINADGTVATMCGNGLRCFCRYLIEQRGVAKNSLRVLTGAGTIDCLVSRDNGDWSVTLDLGIATATPSPDGTIVDIGNRHLVVRGGPGADAARDTASRLQEKFGGDINVEVLTGLDERARTVDLIVNERGAGFTRACGTGGGAVVAALHHDGLVATGDEWTLRFPGGSIRYRRDGRGHIILRGDARFVFSGTTDA
ncbi:MAG TPA: diaminopimelate epimerase [bacterium]|nr:diaminopimelate epimerase [bacterium]